MEYEWDENKAKYNYKKHGIYFADAVSIFSDNFAINIFEEHPKEERFIIIGMDAFSRVLVVVYTWKADNLIRLISARKATKSERKQYEQS